MRIVAILAAYNEERFIGGCLDHLIRQGVEAYLIDNSSTDRTVEIAREYLGRGLLDIETMPRPGGVHRWPVVLRRKEELAASIDADWFMHMDPDEIRLAPSSNQTLAEAFADVDAKGYNAVNFLEFTFIPTKESPEHNHPDFQQTMRWYYHFARKFPYQVKAWKRQSDPVNLAKSGGHRVGFQGLCLYPESFKMKHYQFLSLSQARIKYLENKKYDPSEAQSGLVGWRSRLIEKKMQVPPESELNFYTSDDELSLSKPRTRHVIEDWALPEDGVRELERQPTVPPKPLPSTAPKPPNHPPPVQLIVNGLNASGVEASRRDLPIVVGGCYGSGTPLLRRVLDEHPRIYCGPELEFFRDFHRDYSGIQPHHGSFASSVRQILPEYWALKTLGNTFMDVRTRAATSAKKPRWADNNPENVIYLEDWQKLLNDNWLFVHVVRNPLDTISSMEKAGLPTTPHGLDELVELYKRYTKAGLELCEKTPDRYYCLQYEKLVRNPYATVTNLMGWLGEDFAPPQLAFSRPDLPGESRDIDPEKPYSESVGRWKEAFTQHDAEYISEECDPLWREITGEADAPPRKKNKGKKGLLGWFRS